MTRWGKYLLLAWAGALLVPAATEATAGRVAGVWRAITAGGAGPASAGPRGAGWEWPIDLGEGGGCPAGRQGGGPSPRSGAGPASAIAEAWPAVLVLVLLLGPGLVMYSAWRACSTPAARSAAMRRAGFAPRRPDPDSSGRFGSREAGDLG